MYINDVILPKQTIVRHMKNTTKLNVYLKGANNHWEFLISQLVHVRELLIPHHYILDYQLDCPKLLLF